MTLRIHDAHFPAGEDALVAHGQATAQSSLSEGARDGSPLGFSGPSLAQPIPDDIREVADGIAANLPPRVRQLNREFASEIIARAIMAERERSAQVARDWLDGWANDLYGTFESYIEAKTTGKHAGRHIHPETAKLYAQQFRERAEAVAGCSEHVADAIRGVKP